MATTVNLRTHQGTCASPDIQRTDAFWPIDLVGRKRHQVYRHRPQIDGQLAHRLGCIHVQQSAMGAHTFANGSEIGDGAQFVVDRHQ
ncbi:hypothetical protein D3C73_1356370 [compost metagenome]